CPLRLGKPIVPAASAEDVSKAEDTGGSSRTKCYSGGVGPRHIELSRAQWSVENKAGGILLLDMFVCGFPTGDVSALVDVEKILDVLLVRALLSNSLSMGFCSTSGWTCTAWGPPLRKPRINDFTTLKFVGSGTFGSTGHIKLTDFGLSKIGPVFMEADVNEGCLEKIISGTPLYIAPEVYLGLSYGKPVDWWALGIIMYQFLVGFTPFSGDNLDELGYQVIKNEVIWPRDEDALPPDAQNLITLLLMKISVRRLGTRGAREVKEHPFFQELNLDDLLSENSRFLPHQPKEDDTSCFRNQSEIFSDFSSDDDDNNDSESSVDCESTEDEVESSEDTEQASLELPYFCSVTFRFREVYNSSLPPSSYSQLKQSCLFKKPLYWRLDQEQGEDDDDNDEGYGEEDTEGSEDLMDQASLEDQDDQEDLERDTEELCNDIMFLSISCAEEEGEEKEKE
ncbi:hypothetical protein INR49_015034, partial [Caranx melampygus]